VRVHGIEIRAAPSAMCSGEQATLQTGDAPDFVGNAARRTLHSRANIVVDNVNQLGHWIEGVGKDVWAARATLPCHTFPS
jgi:hypothetical protein